MERYNLSGDMENQELASADLLGQRLATIIKSLGKLSSKDAIALVWNEFGGCYTYNHDNLWLGLRKDVRAAIHKHGEGDIRYDTTSHNWISRKHIEDRLAAKLKRREK
jgi:hypothetical protein